MSDFIDFARSHGLLIDHVEADGRVHRCRTEAKPRKRNGAYAWDGVRGFVQDWTIHPEAIPYRGQQCNPIGNAPERPRSDAKAREGAEVLARAIVARSSFSSHPYLIRKGLPNEFGLVDPEDGHLIVPMMNARNYGEVVSVQRIAADGTKLFLRGGTAKDAVFHLGRGATDVLVEGYATGLSVRLAMKAMYRPARVVVCFSAGNLSNVSRLYPRAVVVADNDVSGAGETAARKTGLRWVMPARVGDDANDLHQRDGIDAVRDLLRGVLP